MSDARDAATASAPQPHADGGAGRNGNSSVRGRIVRALRHRNYRLFFAGQSLSLCGTFLGQVAAAWLVYRLTQSAWMLGVVGFASQIPMFLLVPFAGVWADRWDRRRLLVVTQVLSMLQSFALAGVAWAAAGGAPVNVVVGAIVGLALFQGMVNAFDMPARQAFVVQMVDDRADLPNAIALNSTMVHLARLVGPAMAGFLIQLVGEAGCFALDGLSYAAVIVSLLMMRVPPAPARRVHVSVTAELLEGLRYVWGFSPIRVLLLLMAIMSLFGMPSLSVLMPLFADALSGPGRGAQTLGMLMAASGMGALAGAVYLAARPSVVGLGRIIVTAGVLFGAAIFAFALSGSLWLSLAIVPFAGLGMLLNFASANTVLQTLADEDKRGRVMSFFTMAFVGMAPFGSLLAGALASRLGPGVAGARWTLVFAGAVCIAAAGVFGLMLPRMRTLVRPIYIQKGILPSEVAAGLETATEVVSERDR
jgi:MFS family permease